MIVINKESVIRDPRLFPLCMAAISRDYRFFSSVYPEFADWFKGRVVPGVLTGERTVVLEQRAGNVVGFLILKHTASERKLCTLRVREELQKRGLGIRLFETAFEILETSKPLLSVADVNLAAFERIFRYFDFQNETTYRNLYRPNSTEYSFNGVLVNGSDYRSAARGNARLKRLELLRQLETLPLIV
jgi:ribosomal protein S18 acetylase RimI-like enzyme